MTAPAQGERDRRHLPIQPRASRVPAAHDIRAQREPFPAPDRVRAPQGAPNVLVILLDDMGFGASSAFGGPCPMPVAERLSEGGTRFNRFHTTAICSPTRAALLTGRNHHSVGMGVVTDFATRAPGYTGIRPLDAAPLARTLNENGYATGCFGKWHQIPQEEITPTGPFTHWPTHEGFETFYGIIGGADDQFHPSLFDGTTQVEPPRTPEEGYHLSEDLVDRTTSWIRQVRGLDPERPWFAYLPFGATHSPFQVPQSWKDRHRGAFAHGWDEQRDRTLARQIELGVVPPQTQLTAWPDGAPHWDDLSDAERQVAERLMEVYAAFAEHTDAQVGRLVDFLTETGELDNTLVFYILGDNGASAEGRLSGTFNEQRTYNGLPETAEEILPRLDEIGGPTSYVNYPVSWALAMDTPFQWTKQVASHFGGTRNGLVVHWPAGLRGSGDIRDQWHHVIDVAPTVLEAAGIPHPETVDGIEQKPIEGTSMLYALRNAEAPDEHLTQYFEVFGNRGIHHRGWTAVTKHRSPWDLSNRNPIPFEDDVWELYDIGADFSQARDLAGEHPERLAELQALFLDEARRFDVLPLDDRGIERIDPSIAGRAVNDFGGEVVLAPTTRRLPPAAYPKTANTSFRITVPVTVGDRTPDGVLVSWGNSFAGASFYLREGVLSFAHNLCGVAIDHVRAAEGTAPLTPGPHELVYDFTCTAPPGTLGGPGVGRLFIDGLEVGSAEIPETVKFAGSRLTVGANPGTAVTPDYAREGEYRFNATIGEVRLSVSPPVAVPSPEQELAAELVVH